MKKCEKTEKNTLFTRGEKEMKVILIGGSGHIGTYLIPRLVEAGHDVTNITRGLREPYLPHAVWRKVKKITMDRTAEESRGSFGEWRKDVDEEAADRTWDHIARSPNYSIAKARRLLDYRPRYGSLQAIAESLGWLVENSRLAVTLAIT